MLTLRGQLARHGQRPVHDRSGYIRPALCMQGTPQHPHISGGDPGIAPRGNAAKSPHSRKLRFLLCEPARHRLDSWPSWLCSALVGRCDSLGDPATCRTGFATWCAVLGARPRPDHMSGGVTRLQAFIDDLDGVHVHLVADIFAADTTEANYDTR